MAQNRGGRAPESEAELLRRLVQERKQARAEQQVKEAHLGDATDQLWSQRRDELGPRLIDPARAEVIRRARAAAQEGGLSLAIDLGVDEKRLRHASAKAALSLAEAVLSPQAATRSDWSYLARVGWLLQTRDGQDLSPHGRALCDALLQMGLKVSFTPFHIQDSHAEPFVNAALHLTW